MENRQFALDLRTVGSIEDLHGLLKTTFDFPDYYGRNWDALWDCLGEIDRAPMTITLIGWGDACQRLGWKMNIFFQLLSDFRAEREGSVAIVVAEV